MDKLIELQLGCWCNPAKVIAISAIKNEEGVSVKLFFSNGEFMRWPFSDLETAHGFVTTMAIKINERRV